MARCSFCRGPIEKGTGSMYVKTDGAIILYCSSKCRHNDLKLHRTARELKWTTAYRREKSASGKKKEEKKV